MCVCVCVCVLANDLLTPKQQRAAFSELARYTHAQTHSHTHTHIYTHKCAHVHTHALTHTRAHTHAILCTQAGHLDFINEIRPLTCIFLGFPSLLDERHGVPHAEQVSVVCVVCVCCVCDMCQ